MCEICVVGGDFLQYSVGSTVHMKLLESTKKITQKQGKKSVVLLDYYYS